MRRAIFVILSALVLSLAVVAVPMAEKTEASLDPAELHVVPFTLIKTSWVSDSSLLSGISLGGGGIDQYYSPAIADFNDDGKYELLLGRKGYADIDAYYWDGSAWVSNSSLLGGISLGGGGIDQYYSPAIADFNDDGKYELLLGRKGYADIDAYYWDGSAWVSNSSLLGGIYLGGGGIDQYYSPAIADFNGDGKYELLLGRRGYADIDAYYCEILVPTVTTQDATSITTNSATLSMNYTVGGYSSVQVRFAYKKSADSAWSYTDWVAKEVDGAYAELRTGLSSNTEYEFKAQLKYNDTVIEGGTLQFTTDKSSLPPSQGCFIATAAYGTPTAEQIDVLREFRDIVLLESTAGSQFVALYYQLSPPVADFISGSNFLRTLVRELLVDPIVWVVEATGDIWQN